MHGRKAAVVGFAFAERAAPQAESKASQGKDALSKKMYPEAIQYFADAIELDPNNRVYFANRFTAYMAAGLYNKAADDAEMCIGIPLCTTP